MLRPEGMDSEVTVYRMPSTNLPRASHLKHVVGLVGFVSTVVGTLLALGVIHPLGETEDALAAATANTADAGSAKTTFTAQLSAGGTELKVSGDGGYDFRTQRGEVTYRLPPVLAGVFGTSTVPTRFDGDTTYMYLPHQSPDRPWVRSDSSAESLQSELDVFLELVPDDPSRIFEFLTNGGDVEEVGEESLFGAQTTRYRASVDVEELVAHAPADVQDRVQAAAAGLQGDEAIVVDVWIDDAQFVRRLTLAGQLGDVGNMVMTVDLYDFGTKVDAKAPPASRVIDEAELAL